MYCMHAVSESVCNVMRTSYNTTIGSAVAQQLHSTPHSTEMSLLIKANKKSCPFVSLQTYT